jgi:hypothetical protein
MATLADDLARLLIKRANTDTCSSDLADWFEKWAPRRTGGELLNVLKAMIAEIESED